MDSQREDADRNLILSSPDELEEYLSSSVLLWRLKGSNLPLSPGNLLLARISSGGNQDEQTNQTLEKITDIIRLHKSAWDKKCEAELLMRMQQWKTQIDDIKEAGGIDLSYRYNVRIRVIIQLLLDELSTAHGKIDLQLQHLDEFLTGMTIPGEFIWNEELKGAFPPDKFGYLYVKYKGAGK
jgi:hypothetical protein